MKKIIFFILYLFSTQVKGQDTLKTVNETNDTATFNRVEIEAHYPGGDLGWQHYLVKNLRYPIDAITYQLEGVVVVRFIVDENGEVTNVYAEKGAAADVLKLEAVRLIKESGKWIPAIQNSHNVKSFKKQPFTFKIRVM